MWYNKRNAFLRKENSPAAQGTAPLPDLGDYMTYYFIDFENVHETGLKGVENLPAEDRVHLFYTVNANKVSWELFEVCRSSNIILHKVAAGKQALDMMLSSFLGATVATDPGAKFVVISRDRDYDPVVDFWNMAEPPVAVSRFTSIAAACGQPAEAEDPDTEEQPVRRRVSVSRSRRGRTPLQNGTQRFMRENAQKDAAPAEEPKEAETLSATVTEAPEAAPAEPVAEKAVQEQTNKETKTEPEKEEAGSASEKRNTRSRRPSRSRAATAKTAEPEEPKPETAEAPAEPEKAPKPEKKADPAKTEKKPAERRSGAESNAVHNAVQKVLAQEKVESASIAFLASLTAKNWGKPNDKQLIYRAVIKQFGQKEGLRLYGIMKPCLKG